MTKVVVVDDNHIELEMLNNMLTDSGHEVVSLSSAHSIEKICEEVNPECVILDLMMPHKNGIEIYCQLQSNEQTKHIPVIFVTGSGSLRQQCSSISNQTATYLEKPVDQSVLMRKVRECGQLSSISKIISDIQHQLKDTALKLNAH